MKGFNVGRGLCAECVDHRRQARAKKAAQVRVSPTKTPSPQGPKSWRCPTCLKRIDVDIARTVLVSHQNARGQLCAGSGHELPQKSADAMDYRVAGSFEGGRR